MLDKLDLLGGKVTYKIFGHSYFRIPFGGFLTLILFSSFSYFLIDIIVPFIKRDTPRVTLENLKTLDPPPYNLYNNKFFLAYRVNIPGVDVNKIFNITASYHEVQSSKNSIKHVSKSIGLRKAELSDFVEQEYVYENLGIEASAAWVLDFDTNMYLKGSAVAKVFSYVAIEVNLWGLDDDTLGFVYYSLANSTATLQIFFSDISIRLTNYTKPYTNFVSFFQDDISMFNHKSASLEFSTQNITLDLGYAFKSSYDTIIQTMYQISNVKVSSRGESQKNVYTANIILNKLSNNYIVSYMKIPELFSLIGGTFSVLYFTFSALNGYVNDYILNVKLIENVFNLDRQLDDLKGKEVNSSKVKQDFENFEMSNSPDIKNPNSNSERKLRNDFLHDEEGHNNNELNISELDKSGKSLKKGKTVIIKKKSRRKVFRDKFFTWEDSIFTLFLFCCKSAKIKRRHELYEKAKQCMSTYMDVIKVTKKLIEVDIIKYLILNPNQQAILGIIGKPYITLNEKTLDKNKFSHSYLDYARIGMRSDYNMKNMEQHEKDRIIFAFNELKAKDVYSIIDRKLISSCEGNLDLVK
jgi:hypothetical protein